MLKNIIFDFGGVIYDIDHNISKKAFQKLGLNSFDTLYGHQEQQQLFEQMERGELTDNEFRSAIRKIIPNNVSDIEIDDAWCALLIGFDKKKIDLLEALRHNYHLFLLSNTNNIHAKRFIPELDAYKNFRALFNDVWLSHEIGKRKPEKEFYLDLLEKHGMKTEETLFIDDLYANIEAAKNLGIQTYYLNNQQSILDLFNKDDIFIETNQ